MTRSARAGHDTPFLPPAISLWLRQRARQILGLGLAVLGAALALAIASFDASDPSLNTATATGARNLLGVTGAVVADFALQATGVAALLPALALLVWGWRLVASRRFSLWGLRIATLWLAFALGSAAAAAVPAPEAWPLRSGLGGVIGSHLLDFVHAWLAGWGSPTAPTLPALAAGLAATLSLFYALAISAREWRAAGTALWRLVGRGALSNRQKPGRERPAGGAREGRRSNRGGKARRQPLIADKRPRMRQGKRAERERQPSLDFTATGASYRLPDLDLLKPPPARGRSAVDEASLEQNARYLESVLADFRVKGKVTKIRPGPVVTLYELRPAPGTKAARIIALADDIARSMSAVSARVAVVPGRNVIGIELPNAERETVYLREILASEAFERSGHRLPLILGKDIAGAPVIVDLSRMPHLLIAGSTGAGKSVAINTMILSLIYRLPPESCRLILVDPKMLELSVYEDIPQLLTPVVTDPGKAVVALKWAVREMEERYRVMSKLGVRNIETYNARLADARRRGATLEPAAHAGTEAGGLQLDEPAEVPAPLPFIVVIVDEMADLMLVSGKEIEIAVQRLSQMARAAGIHLIMATQRPSVDVITGTIKANFPTRISFQVTSKIDSRTILGEQGAEQLLRQGDMLYLAGGGRMVRVHGPFVDDSEVEAVVSHVKSQGRPYYVDEVTEEEDNLPDEPGGVVDERYEEAVALVLREGKASTSFIQRHLQIGYNRAARMIDRMEAEGIISPANHAGKREILGPAAGRGR